jgi:hypothetical protein
MTEVGTSITLISSGANTAIECFDSSLDSTCVKKSLLLVSGAAVPYLAAKKYRGVVGGIFDWLRSGV